MTKKDDSDSKLYAFLGVLLTVIGFIIVMATKKHDKYAMYYGKQGLVLFIALVIVWIIGLILLPVIIIGWIISTIIWIAWLLLWILGLVNALSGEEKPVPFIGSFAKMIKL